MNNASLPAWLIRLTTAVLLLVLLVGLAAFAYAGTYARFWADDYCYSSVARTDGLLKGTLTWDRTQGNRFGSFWLVAVSDLFGPGIIKVMPGLLLVLWTAGWYSLLAGLRRWRNIRVPRGSLLLAALLMVFFTALLMPTRLQTLYWRMASLHYSLPMPLMLLTLGLILRALAGQWKGIQWILALVAVAGLAFLAGGQGETGSAMQVGLYAALMSLALLFLRAGERRRGMILLVPALAGALAALGVMARSPSNAWRLDVLPPPESFGQLVSYTLRYSMDFVVDSLKTQPLPNLVFLAGAAALTVLVLQAGGVNLDGRKAVLGLALSAGLAFGLIVCSFAPSAYAGLNYPGPRALMPGRFAFLAGEAGIAFFVVAGLQSLLRRIPERAWAAAAVLALLAVSVYTARSINVPLAEARDLAARAQLWDARDAQIRADRDAGMASITIRQADVVDTLEDYTEEPEHWVNACAAVYYGVESITALP